MTAKNSKTETVATQTFITNKICSATTKFDPVGMMEVGGKDIEPMNNAIYVSNAVLAKLGNPKKITVTVAAA